MSGDAQPEPAPRTKTSSTAVFALVLSLIPCSSPVGLLLGVVALRRMGKNPLLRGKKLAIAAVVIPLVMAPITAAFAVPYYLRVTCLAKQREAEVNLKSLHASQMGYRLEHGAYAADLAAAGFTPGGDEVLYDYRVLRASADAYEAEAVARDPSLHGDRWLVRESGEPTNESDGCR